MEVGIELDYPKRVHNVFLVLGPEKERTWSIVRTEQNKRAGKS